MINRVKNIKQYFPARFINKGIHYIEKKPITSFLISLGTLLILIVVSNLISRPKEAINQPKQPKSVKVYQVGTAPKVSLQAKVEKTHVITVVAQSGGIVQQIFRNEGDEVGHGATLIGLSTNYQGGNISSLQRQLAQQQYNNLITTFDAQKDLLKKQRDIAEKNDSNNDELRKISEQSLSETRDQLALNESILNTINDNLKTLEEATNSAENQQLILTTKQLKSQSLAAVSQLKSAIRNSEYQVSGSNPTAQLSDLQKEITIKQLEIQDKALDLSREVSLLNVKIAQVSESLMYPSMPFSGRIERIYVRVGQVIAPGTPLVMISGTQQNNTAVMRVPDHIARTLSKLETSKLYLGSQVIDSMPTYVSQEATDGHLYTVIYSIPDEYCNVLTDGQHIQVDIPIGYPDTGSAIPFIPLDAVMQTQDGAYLFVVDNTTAQSRKAKLGSVYGRFVEVKEGLNDGDQVILDRTVVAGDLVTTTAL